MTVCLCERPADWERMGLSALTGFVFFLAVGQRWDVTKYKYFVTILQ